MAGTVNKPKKPKSKRGTTRLRHKIEKASAAKQRKQRKLAKKNPEWRTKLKKNPGIPNLFPYKDKLLDEIEQKRVKKAVEAQRRGDMLKAASQTGAQPEDPETLADAEGDDALEHSDGEEDDGDDDDDMQDVDESNPMAALLASAKAAAAKYDHERAGSSADDDYASDDSSQAIPTAQDSSRKSHDKAFKQVVEQSDVVLYVLDARDPEGTRSREVERSIIAAAGHKRLILILNKIDLVPARVLRGWLLHLRRFFPTLPLRAAAPATNARTHNHHRDLSPQSTAATLFRALKSFAASRQLNRAVSVGVIGYPNVGKSSVINALLGRMGGRRAGGSSGAAKACPAGAEAGVTTSIRAVKIDSKLTLLDSPGIVFPSSSAPSTLSGGLVSLKNATEAHAHLILLNAVPPKHIDDPVPAVSLLLRRLSASPDFMQKLTDVYDIPPLLPNRDDAGDLTTDFLIQVARKCGRLGKGGVPNLNAAAVTVVTDWRDGRIQGWVEPPTLPIGDAVVAAAAGFKAAGNVAMPDQKEIVTEWAAEFKLEGLWGDGQADVEGEVMEQ